MENASSSPEKAYRDVEFLNSRDERTVRILAEYLHSQKLFREEGIQNTIVFFGSARIRDAEATETALAEAKKGAVPRTSHARSAAWTWPAITRTPSNSHGS